MKTVKTRGRPRKKPRVYRTLSDKVTQACSAIAEAGFRSTNHFIETYYASPDGIQGLRAQKDSAYSPAVVMDIWLKNVPSGSDAHLRQCIAQAATQIVVEESTRACRDTTLHMSSNTLDIPYLTTEFGLKTIQDRYNVLFPCLNIIILGLLTAASTYEHRKDIQREGKADLATKMAMVIISMLLYGRNSGTNAFQMVMGMFLASSGASRRVVDNLNHMGLTVSYWTIQRSLQTLSEDAKKRARDFATKSDRLWGIVYDNINFTLRKASQRLDSATQQLNATTLALFSLPTNFSRYLYEAALSVAQRKRSAGARKKFKINELLLDESKHVHVERALKHGIRTMLLTYMPGNIRKNKKLRTKLLKKVKELQPHIRSIGHEKTEFFPLPAVNEEEASVPGTISVVEKIYTGLLGLACELVESQLRLLVGDWLSIRNLRLMKYERKNEPTSFLRFDWIQEASMPFHFQLNAMYALFRTHLGPQTQNGDPSSLEHHRNILRRGKLDPKKPEYNKAKELAFHSLAARLLDCTRLILEKDSYDDLRKWKPSWDEFEAVVDKIFQQYTSSYAAQEALKQGDEYLAHSIFFMRDTLIFWEFCDAIHYADVGRMWVVYDLWVFMMRGAGCHNYGNEILEMKAQFTYELTPMLQQVVERTWLVNRWGKEGRSIPTDLYLEHNNGFTKARCYCSNMFAAMGSNASIEHVQKKSSACVEVLRTLAHEVSDWFQVRDFNRQHKEVSVDSDLAALLNDMKAQKIHTLTRERKIPPPIRKPQKGRRTRKPESAVVDVLEKGMYVLSEGNLFDRWLRRTTTGSGDVEGTGEEDIFDGLDSAFVDPNGVLDVDTGADEDFPECPFASGEC